MFWADPVADHFTILSVVEAGGPESSCTTTANRGWPPVITESSPPLNHYTLIQNITIGLLLFFPRSMKQFLL